MPVSELKKMNKLSLSSWYQFIIISFNTKELHHIILVVVSIVLSTSIERFIYRSPHLFIMCDQTVAMVSFDKGVIQEK